jgi:hypothetical protein
MQWGELGFPVQSRASIGDTGCIRFSINLTIPRSWITFAMKLIFLLSVSLLLAGCETLNLPTPGSDNGFDDNSVYPAATQPIAAVAAAHAEPIRRIPRR